MQLLLNRGALLHRDHNGRNPLHLAAMNGYTQTMELLHSVHSHLLDQVDKDGVSTVNHPQSNSEPTEFSYNIFLPEYGITPCDDGKQTQCHFASFIS